jgi:hypothetical protein
MDDLRVFRCFEDQRQTKLVAAASWAEAARAFGITTAALKLYGSVTGNPRSVGAALAAGRGVVVDE